MSPENVCFMGSKRILSLTANMIEVIQKNCRRLCADVPWVSVPPCQSSKHVPMNLEVPWQRELAMKGMASGVRANTFFAAKFGLFFLV